MSLNRLTKAAVGAALLLVLCAPTAGAATTPVRAAWSWGSNAAGQLGDGTADSSLTPVAVPGMGDVADVAAGGQHSLAVRSSDGTVWAWGSNGAGQLGDGTTVNRSAPVMVPAPDGTSRLLGMVAVAAGEHHSLAVREGGRVFAWGSNTFGQLGDVKGPFPVLVRGLADVVAVAAGGAHSLALRSDGNVWAWGHNGYGQLGDGSTVNRDRPVVVSGLSGVIAITAGRTHSLALRSDGTVWAWGANTDGQLGNNALGIQSVPMAIAGLSGVTAIDAGARHNLALRGDGTVQAWGANTHGQLGNGTTDTSSAPVAVSAPADVAAVAAGSSHSLALAGDGTVWAWGHNASGQLGDATMDDRTAPVAVMTASGGAGVAAGGTHSLALRWGQPAHPGTPAQVRATAGDARARVEWTVPPDGGSPITGYTVEASPGGGTTTVAGTVTSADVTGLTNGQAYTFSVRAINAVGPAAKAASAAAVTPSTVPDAPTKVTAGVPFSPLPPPWHPGGATVDVSWTPPPFDGGSAVSGYRITRHPGGVTTEVGNVTSWPLTGLEYGTSYTFTVAAVNERGPGGVSSPTVEVTPQSSPGAPPRPKATAGDASATVSWTAPPDGGTPIHRYEVRVSPGGRIVEVNDGTAASMTIPGLANGTAHAFEVRAFNRLGESPWSLLSSSATPTPAAVTGLSHTVRFDALTAATPKPRVELRWTKQGSPEAIEVSWSDGSASRSVILAPAQSGYTVTGLDQGKAYSFQVHALDGGVSSPPASVSSLGSAVTAAVTPAVLTFGTSTTVSGRLTRAGTNTALAGQPVRLQIRTQDASGAWSAWSNVGSAVQTSSTGTYTITHRPPRNARYRVVFAGAGSRLGSVSPVRAVNVAPRVTASLSPTSMRVGSTARLTGTVSPNLAGKTVYLQRSVDGRWVDVRGASQRLSSASTYSFAITPARQGTYTYRVHVPASPPYVQGLSPSRSLRVS